MILTRYYAFTVGRMIPVLRPTTMRILFLCSTMNILVACVALVEFSKTFVVRLIWNRSCGWYRLVPEL